MATRLKEVDAVMVGMGWTGSIMARELTKAGLTVVGLERGEDLTPREHFALPNVRDVTDGEDQPSLAHTGAGIIEPLGVEAQAPGRLPGHDQVHFIGLMAVASQ